jgi:adenylate kinase family enzyme
VHLDIDDETAIERVKSRNRNDNLSDEESTRKRLHEYQEHTIPALTFFREQGTAISINGEQPVDEIHREILNRLASYGSDS